jgi:hypothetical protein
MQGGASMDRGRVGLCRESKTCLRPGRRVDHGAASSARAATEHKSQAQSVKSLLVNSVEEGGGYHGLLGCIGELISRIVADARISARKARDLWGIATELVCMLGEVAKSKRLTEMVLRPHDISTSLYHWWRGALCARARASSS